MMNQKTFNLWHRISAVAALVISAVTYLATIEPTASFWDCGEFIASSYKLEVGHPPGNPVFQLFARFFTLFGDNMHAAVLVNALSAICSALTIFFLYLTIVFLVKRLVKKDPDGDYTPGQAVAIIGSGLVGALAYCFSDTFWFSAVEGEVYAMSSLFTAAVFWAMTMWYDHADDPHANRWIVLIAFLMGLSIGVHLLNLLAIPALVFMYFFKKRENTRFTLWEVVKIFAIGVVILGLILFVVIPILPKLAAYVDLFFVNTLGLPYNTGAAVFMLLVFAACFWGLFVTLRQERVFLNTALLCLTSIIIGFSVFSIDIIRSCAKTPTNEYQPDNAFTLVRYLSREQYGSSPIVYGQYFDAPYDLKNTTYWAPLDGKYKKVQGPLTPKYRSSGKMLFPRMWQSLGNGKYEEFYSVYTQGKGHSVPGATYRKPTMGANLLYFFDYQLNWMYWRYFMWNFVGRQNDIHSPTPGDVFFGNWESGIDFLDEIRLGSHDDAPEALKDNKGKNHYFFLPLILGLLGLFFQFFRDKRGFWLTFLMFFMTGIAIVIYLNQPPLQVRERDYAYAGSFYFFCVWIGLAVAAVYTWIKEATKRDSVLIAGLVTVLFLGVPALMAAQNWDDHDRSNRATAPELAANYLNSCGPDGILVTHGDNDTFPLWYAQEVENVRTDVRICNTSLLGTDWHIDQMTWACNESAPLKLSIPHEMYLYGSNEYVPINDTRGGVMSISDVVAIFRHPELKVPLTNGKRVDYIASRQISVPVNKENVIKYGILSSDFEEVIPDEIILTIPDSKDFITKPELFFLDLLANYQWDRPLHFLSGGGDININIGIKDYLMFEGYSHKFVPIKTGSSNSSVGLCDPNELHRLFTEEYKWDALARGDYFIDHQNLYSHLGVMSVRGLFYSAAKTFYDLGYNDEAEALVDKGLAIMKHYPLESICVGFSSNDYMVCSMVDLYYKLGKKEKAAALAAQLGEELLVTAKYYLDFYQVAQTDFELCGSYIYFLTDIMKLGGDAEGSENLRNQFNNLVTSAGVTIQDS